jgi:PhnB protein
MVRWSVPTLALCHLRTTFGFNPRTMNTATPYLNFPGTCEEAFTFYKSVFGGEFGMISRFKEMPAEIPVPENYGEQVMHISLNVGGKPMLFGSDAPEGFGPPFAVGNNVHLSLSADSEADARRVFEVLGQGGQIVMPLEATFWSKLFGMVSDRYGVSWMIGYGDAA